MKVSCDDLAKKLLGMLIAILLLSQMIILPQAGAADLTTKYRVYAENKIIMEYATLNQAITHAKTLRNSHIEQISTRKWVWDNLPRYRVYQYDTTLPEWQFATLQQAINVARYYNHSSVRELSTGGWVWNNYATPKRQYQLQQYDTVLPNWTFDDLASAQKEAKKWGNVHIIDLGTNTWVWDNISDKRKKELRSGELIYQIYIANHTEDAWKFSYLEDAIQEALKIDNSIIYHIKKQKPVYANMKHY